MTIFSLTSSCSSKPPADFAPDPGLVARIREIRITTARRTCPGQTFAASYSAVLDDGTAIPFAARYDKDRPPRLHVVFLERSSDEADALEDGGWRAEPDPLASATSGFRLNVVLKAKPAIRAGLTLDPEYGCLRHAFGFEGRPGGTGEPGGDGPDVTVRLAILRSPFYARLLVAGIEVGEAPPFYLLADANAIPPRAWLIVESQGGSGGRGATGARGQAGNAGAAGCPGAAGGPGGIGGRGGVGGPGGRGGRATIMAPSEEPFLAGVVDARSPGGEGGEGGRGGDGGPGGKGGELVSGGGQQCQRGQDGPAGSRGPAGPSGSPGRDGPRPQVITVSTREIFGAYVPPGLEELLGRTPRR